MKKIFLLITLCLVSGIAFAQKNACEGKAIPFSMANKIDINGDGVNEKFFMCESQKEKGKTLFRVLDGKTNEIILSVVLNINPSDIIGDINSVDADKYFYIEIDHSLKEPFSYLTVSEIGVAVGGGGSSHFLFYKGKYIGVIETYDHSVGEGGLDESQIEYFNYNVCGKTPCPAVYAVTTEGPYHIPIQVHKKLLSVYALYEGKLEQIYKEGDGDERMMAVAYNNTTQKDFFKGKDAETTAGNKTTPKSFFKRIK